MTKAGEHILDGVMQAREYADGGIDEGFIVTTDRHPIATAPYDRPVKISRNLGGSIIMQRNRQNGEWFNPELNAIWPEDDNYGPTHWEEI